jgi:hypothetical protein
MRHSGPNLLSALSYKKNPYSTTDEGEYKNKLDFSYKTIAIYEYKAF